MKYKVMFTLFQGYKVESGAMAQRYNYSLTLIGPMFALIQGGSVPIWIATDF